MSVELPNELVWVLGAIGVVWPNVDEDQLRAMADQFRQIAGDLEDQHSGAMQSVEQMLGMNSSQSLEIFQALWSKVSGRHLKQLGEGIKVLAEAISIGADIIEGMKVAAIGEFVAFVAQTAAVAAESVATLGLGAGAEAVVVETTRTIVKGIIDQAIAQVGQQFKQAMMAPILDTLMSAAEDLGAQLLGDALGVSQCVEITTFAGANHRFEGYGGGAGYQGVADRLRAAGPGSAAIVQVDWPKIDQTTGQPVIDPQTQRPMTEGGHAFNAVNVGGKVVWVDMQTNTVSENPINASPDPGHVWSIALDGKGKPVP